MPFAEFLNPAPAASGFGTCFEAEKGRERDAARSAAHATPLPCQSSNNSIETASKLSPYQRKNAYSINENLNFCIDRFGIEKVGFLTLTFPKNLTLKDANRRFNSLSSNFLDRHFETWVCVREFTKGGRPHFHLVVVCREDIRTGFDFGAYLQMTRLSSRPERRRKHAVEIKALSRSLSPTPALRAIWSDLRRMLPLYQFGRSELIPIRKTVEALSRYVGGYIRKSMDFRPAEAKGARLITYAKNFPRKVVGHAWSFNSDGSRFWRKKVALFAEWHRIKSFDGLSARFGSRWAWWFRDVIDSINLFPFLERGMDERRVYLEGLDHERIPHEFWDNGGFLGWQHIYRPNLPEVDGKPVPPPRRLQSAFAFHLSNWNQSREQVAEAARQACARTSAYLNRSDRFAAAKEKVLAVPVVSRAVERSRNFTRLVHPEYYEYSNS